MLLLLLLASAEAVTGSLRHHRHRQRHRGVTWAPSFNFSSGTCSLIYKGHRQIGLVVALNFFARNSLVLAPMRVPFATEILCNELILTGPFIFQCTVVVAPKFSSESLL